MEAKIVLSLLVPGAKRLTQGFCEKNPKDSYNQETIKVEYYSGKNNYKKRHSEDIVIKLRKNELITHIINMGKEAYTYMIATPSNPELAKFTKASTKKKKVRIWDTMSIDQRLKGHFDLIASDFHAESYTYKILDE